MSYPHHNIWVNGRCISLRDIVEASTPPLTEAESETFSFIRDWAGGRNEFVFQTSGSTGMPKRVLITRAQMEASARMTQNALGLTPRCNALVCLDVRYIAGKMMIVRSFVTGMRMYIVDPCANPLSKIPVDTTIHFAAFVPYQVRSMLESKHPHLLDTLSTSLIGGAPMTASDIDALKNFTTQFYLTYGMTETISHVALRKISREGDTGYFEALPGIEIQTDDRECLVIRAPFLGNETVTNDLAELVGKNKFMWKGRYDNVINTGGHKVSPEILEERIGKIITRSGQAFKFFIHAVPDDRFGQRVIMVIEGTGDETPAVRKLKALLRESLAPHEVPAEVYAAPSFVYTPTNKIRRAESFQAAHLLLSLKA